MAYEDNILTNPSAETGDTTGWTAVNVTVVGGTTAAIDLRHKIGPEVDEYEGRWMAHVRPTLMHVGSDGTYYFLLASDASLAQTLLASDVGDLPVDIKLTVDFKFTTAQDLWDANVRGQVHAVVTYSDGTVDTFVIPCVVGLTYDGRSLLNSWLRQIATCVARKDLAITSIVVTATTVALTDGLKINKIEVQKSNEPLETTPVPTPGIGEDGYILSSDWNLPGNMGWLLPSQIRLPAFVFIISGVLVVNAYQGPVLPVPYVCTAVEIVAYVAEPEPGGVSSTVTINLYRNGSSIGSVSILAGSQLGSAVGNVPLAKEDLLNLGISVVDGNAKRLTLQVRCI